MTGISGLSHALYALMLCGLIGTFATTASASVNLTDKDDWKVNVGGFIELDTIHDSVRSFTEVIGNGPVDRPSAIAGQLGREQFSLRNTRFSLEVLPPLYDGWKTRAYLETDFLGYEAGYPDISEASVFTSPTMRIRHAYLTAEQDGWLLMAGQTWDFLGWQPYYFLPSVQVAPVPGMLYSRTSQVRAVKTMEIADQFNLQAGVGVMRPPQRDSEYPSLEAGIRLVLDSRKAGFTAGSTGPEIPQPMSLAITGTVRDFAVTTTPMAATAAQSHFLGSGFAADALIPILASSDGKDVGNTLALEGEFTMGKGDGDQFGSWSANLPNPFTKGGVPTPYKSVQLDGGIGAFDAFNNFFLLDVETFNASLQYHLPSDMRTWFSAGYGWLYSDNATNAAVPIIAPATSAKVAYDREDVLFGNVFHNFTPQVRVGLEYARVRTTYADSVVAADNRVQLSGWLIF